MQTIHCKRRILIQMQQKSNHWSEKKSVQIFTEFQFYRSLNKYLIEIKNDV